MTTKVKITEKRFNILKQLLQSDMSGAQVSRVAALSSATISRVNTARTYEEYKAIISGGGATPALAPATPTPQPVTDNEHIVQQLGRIANALEELLEEIK